MATIENARDLFLQGQSPRVVVPPAATVDWSQITNTAGTKPTDNADVTSDKLNEDNGVLLYAGGLTLVGGGSIKGGKWDYGATAEGIFLGWHVGRYKFDLGNSSNYIRWTGYAVEISGEISGNTSLDILGHARFQGYGVSLHGQTAAVEMNKYSAAQYGFAVYADGDGAIAGRCEAANGATGFSSYVEGSGSAGYFVSGWGSTSTVIVNNIATGPSFWALGGNLRTNSSVLVDNLNAEYLGSRRYDQYATQTYLSDNYSSIGHAHTDYVNAVGTDSGIAYPQPWISMLGGNSGFTFSAGGGAVVLVSGVSDARLKTDIEPERLGLEFVRRLRPVTYRRKGNDAFCDVTQHGFIYQDIQPLVHFKQDTLAEVRSDGMGVVNYLSLIAPVVHALQQLDERTQPFWRRLGRYMQRKLIKVQS